MENSSFGQRLKEMLIGPEVRNIKRLLKKMLALMIERLGDRRAVDLILRSPVSRIDIIGAYKILGLREYNSERLENLLKAHQQVQWQPFGVFLNLIEFPEVADLLNIELQKEANSPIPIRLSFGATVFGFTWDYFVSDFVRRNGFWEKEVQSIISRYLKPGDIALDIGANIGCHSALMAHIVGAKGRVHAVEPVDYLFGSLEKMVEFNGFQQVALHKVAISNRADSANIRLHTSNPGGNSLATESFSSDHTGTGIPGLQQVETRTVDEYLLPLCDRCSFIKIDVEGHEGAVLEGARELIRRYSPTLLFEFSPSTLRDQGTDPVSVLSQFCALGMKISIVGMDRQFDSAEEIVRYVESGGSFVEIVAFKPES